MSSNVIRVLFSFARSGGTLLNQLLGVHPDCWVLSEVNPTASVVPLASQAADWLCAIARDRAPQFEELPYCAQVTSLDAAAASRGKALVIRDWVTVNFLAGVGGDEVVPSLVLEQRVYLERAGYCLQPLVLTRRAARVYASIRHNFPRHTNLGSEEFGSAYLAYARAVAGFPKVALERLRETPEGSLAEALGILGLAETHVSEQLRTFADFRWCSGNNTLPLLPESSRARRVLRPELEADAAGDVAPPAAIREADQLLGYAT